MNKLDSYYNLNIDVSSALSKDWNFPSTVEGKTMWNFFAGHIFDSEWLSYTKSLGINIVDAMVFFRKPNSYHSVAHIDQVGSTHAINWVFGGESTCMVWYDLPNFIGDKVTTSAGTGGKIWDRNSLTETARVSIGKSPVLVRVDIPHVVDMQDSISNRWCISARQKHPHVTWEDSVENLKSNNVIIFD